MINLDNISIKVGLGDISFGINESQLIGLIGLPTNREEKTNWGESFHILRYPNLKLDFWFSEKDNYDLGMIDIWRDSICLFGKNIFNKEYFFIHKLILESVELSKPQKHTKSIGEFDELVFYPDISLHLFYNQNKLSRLSVGQSIRRRSK